MSTTFTESVTFTAESLLPANIISVTTRELMQRYSALKTPEALQAARSEIKESLSDDAREMLASIGAEIPFDAIAVNLDFGSFLYDLYEMGSVRPVAPLAVAAHQRRLQNLAERLERGEVSLTAEELAVIRKVLEDDPSWKSAKFNCYVEVGEGDAATKRALTLTSQGIQFYNKTLNAVVKLFEGTNDSTEQPTS